MTPTRATLTVDPAGKLVRGGRVALAVNPRAGLGAERNIRVAREVLEALAPAQVITAAGELGADAAVDSVLVALDGSGNATSQIAREAARRQVDLLVVVGGDGTLADAALALHSHGSSVPILGIGSGSTNAGALVSCQADEFALLADGEFETAGVSALQVQTPDAEVALAFNDVVVGTTICGTVGAEFVNLDAAAFMRGQQVEATPQALASASARVSKSGPNGEVVVAGGLDAGSVVVGFSNTGNLRGQALIGGLGLSSGAGVPAGCLVATAPLVNAGFTAEQHAAIEPLRTAYVGLSAGETISLTGFADGAMLCADGNPLWALQSHDRAQIRLIQHACRTVRPAGGTGK